jgi:hypothetical protein
MGSGNGDDELPPWRALATTGSLLVAVVGTLVLGASLRSEPVTPTPLPADDRNGLSDLALGDPPPFAPDTNIDEGAGSDPLSETVDDRAARARRLLSSGYDWTLQFMVTCRVESATSLLQSVAYDARLHLLPYRHEQQACYRVCWGSYGSRDEAVSEAPLPAALLQVNRDPIPRRIHDLFP